MTHPATSSCSRYLLTHNRLFWREYAQSHTVLRVPVVPGSDPRVCYGNLVERGVRGIVLEAFGKGNIPDVDEAGWLPWLKDMRRQGLTIHLTTQCRGGSLQPDLYRSGKAALEMGITATSNITTPETAVVKLMLGALNVHRTIRLVSDEHVCTIVCLFVCLCVCVCQPLRR